MSIQPYRPPDTGLSAFLKQLFVNEGQSRAQPAIDELCRLDRATRTEIAAETERFERNQTDVLDQIQRGVRRPPATPEPHVDNYPDTAYLSFDDYQDPPVRVGPPVYWDSIRGMYYNPMTYTYHYNLYDAINDEW